MKTRLASTIAAASNSAAFAIFTVACLAALAPASRAEPSIWAPPFVNPANGHTYYILAPVSWHQSEAWAEELGGTLAVVNDADENAWIMATFSQLANTGNLWVGLSDQDGDGTYTWADGSALTFSNWRAGEPSGDDEHYVHLWTYLDPASAGLWNDLPASQPAWAPHGVVEVDPAPVPEPSAYAVAAGGIALAISTAARRRTRVPLFS